MTTTSLPLAAAVNLSDLGAFLNTIIGVVFVAVITAVAAVIRKLKAGNIVDDDAVIARLDADNVKLRDMNAAKDTIIETERRARWRAEDIAAQYRRQLVDAGIEPTALNMIRGESDESRT